MEEVLPGLVYLNLLHVLPAYLVAMTVTVIYQVMISLCITAGHTNKQDYSITALASAKLLISIYFTQNVNKCTIDLQ